MQSATIYSWTFIIYILQLTVSMSLVFDFFEIYLTWFWDLVVDDFVENFKC